MTTQSSRAKAASVPDLGILISPVEELINFTQIKSVLLLTLFFVVQAISLALVFPAVASPGLFVVSIVLVAVAGFLIARKRTPTVTILIARVTGLIAVAAYAFTLEPDPDSSIAGYANQHLATYVVVLLMLARRGRTRQAWLALGGITAICVGYSLTVGEDLVPRLQSVAFNAALLLLGTLFIKALERMARVVANEQRNHDAATSDAAVATLAASEQQAHIARLLETAGPMLTRIAAGAYLTEAEGAECLVIEAQLRDATRAPNLSTGPLTVAVRAARNKGVSVVLFDDRPDSPLQDPLARLLANWLAAELESVAAGTVTIRLLPVGRSPIATMTVSDSDSLMTSSTREFTTYGPAVASAARTPGARTPGARTPANPVPLP